MAKKAHEHYIFRLRYNSVYRQKNSLKKCDNKQDNLVYSNMSYCIYVEHTSGISKRASVIKKEHLSVAVPFDDFLQGITTDNLKDYRDLIFRKDDLKNFLTPVVYPQAGTDKGIEDVEDLMKKYMWRTPSEEAIKECEIQIKTMKKKMNDLRLKVDSETPLGRWLYQYIFTTLDKSYIVETQVENLKELGPNLNPAEINEYATSKADLVIKKGKPVSSDRLKCAYVSVDDHHCGANCVSTVPSVSGMVAELKIDDETTGPVWECFCNMSGVAASLAVRVLSQGVLVDTVIMFGLVVTMEHLERTK